MKCLRLGVLIVSSLVLIGCGQQDTSPQGNAHQSTGQQGVGQRSAGSQGAFQALDMKSKDLAGVQTSNLSAAESWGRWTDGTPVIFKFAGGLPSDFRLILTVNGYFGQNEGKPIEVKVAEKKQTFVGPMEGPIQLEFKDIPRGTDTLTIGIPAPQSPKELGLSGDERKLGIGLARLEIAPL